MQVSTGSFLFLSAPRPITSGTPFPAGTTDLQAWIRNANLAPDWLRIGLTFLVPVAFAVTVPAQALTNRLTPLTLLGALGLTLLLAGLARLIWRLGVRSYSGASA